MTLVDFVPALVVVAVFAVGYFCGRSNEARRRRLSDEARPFLDAMGREMSQRHITYGNTLVAPRDSLDQRFTGLAPRHSDVWAK